ncbi:Leucine rich repeat [Phytophthora infestans]|uniref:Leucine rich repeat n=1 Tax=Phytophthora infestans TaxID=4787 RepID=A0A833SDK6_PHYIN|nr:Leucine rich repeat [Phytophthora infestans]
MATPRTSTLTADVVMNRAGVYDLLALKELILRDEELTEVDETCAQSLASLEILSLSHNRLTSLDNFQYLVNLIELNVNFNQIERLDSLQCSGLEKLFIANNQVVDISPLRKLLKLNTLSVYGNRITDLDSALHTCRSLPRLQSLDLGGNPCSHDVVGYKFRVVRALSRLKKLDGDHITQLDKDLTEEFFATMHKSARPSINGFIGARPFTAPAAGVRGRLTASLQETTVSNGIDPFASSLMPRGNVRLFRDDFLNNNPILLEYLSQDAGSAPVNEGNTTLSSDGENSLPATSGFVDKMRSANPLPKNDTETSDADSTSTDGQKKISLSPNVSTSHLGVDPSDPNTTIRKLLKHIEVLMETLDKYKNHQLNAVSESLLEENKQLQTENNNIPILQEEIQDLKKRLARAEGDPGGAKVQETKRVKSLEQQNTSLQRENARLREILLRQTKETEESLDVLKSPRILPDNESSKDQDDTMLNPRRLSHSGLLDESALVDVELTELILQNEVSLELIRNDIKNTKKEWEEQFQRAKAAESERVRPQTSMGFTSSSNRPRESLDSSVTVAQNGATRDRRLHTSAGFRHGPEAHLLEQMPVHPLTSIREASRDGSSTTNILTL